jgi:hypothetical protein
LQVATSTRLLGVNIKVLEQSRIENPKKDEEVNQAMFEVLKTIEVLIQQVS